MASPYSEFDIPGVYARVIDATQLPDVPAPTTLAMVGTATRGPFNEVTEIRSLAEFFNTFGPPDPDSQSYYAADAFFARGNLMRFVRIQSAASPAAKANKTLAVSVGGSGPVLTALEEGTYAHDIDCYVTVGSSGVGYVKLSLFYLGALVEEFDDLPDASNGDWATPINGNSNFISVANGTAGGTITVQSFTFDNGDNGITGLVVGDFIGTLVGNTATGWQLFRNRRKYPADIFINPDFQDSGTGGVVDEMLAIAEERGDCHVIIDTPDGKSPSEAADYIGGNVAGQLNLDSDWGSAFYPWLKMRDDKNNHDVWTPPSGHIAGAIAYSDQVAWPWFSFAGIKRGLLVKALDVRTPLDDDDVRTLYKGITPAEARVNALIKSNGIFMDGHKTVKATNTSALRFNEVRRALVALRGYAENAGRQIQFDPNDVKTYRKLEGQMASIIPMLLRERAFRELKFECTEKMQKAATRRLHQVKARFYVKPNIAVEVIIIDIVLTAEGMSFSEQVLAE